MNMLYAFVGFDHPDSGPLRAANRPEHLEFLKSTFGTALKAAGPHLDPVTGDPVGSLVIVEGETQEDVVAAFAEDPYAKAGLFISSHVLPYKLALGAWAATE